MKGGVERERNFAPTRMRPPARSLKTPRRKRYRKTFFNGQGKVKQKIQSR